MKRFFYLCILLCAAFTSCKKDETEIDNDKSVGLNIDHTGYFANGGTTAKMNMFCLDVPYPSGIGIDPGTYYEMIKTIEDYSKMEFVVEREYKSFISPTYLPEEEWQKRRAISKIEKEYLTDKAKFVYDVYLDNIDKYRNGWPVFYTAYTNGDVSITCDKVLFGEEPGSNLSKYFTIRPKTDCLIAGKDSTRFLYKFPDEMPTRMDKYFSVKETWLSSEYCLRFASSPEEKYDELTFKLSIPLLIDDVHEYAVSLYNGTNEPMKTTERTFEAECKVKFNW